MSGAMGMYQMGTPSTGIYGQRQPMNQFAECASVELIWTTSSDEPIHGRGRHLKTFSEPLSISDTANSSA
ncbi:hypothetical protein BDY21DRAFT_371173 [Lineolata rhizophorae]|uniref:Uncharacterized protein n=1 Tax=Lineolata rhizophorae TaxID=578093 RepID=A0A6A6P2U2_9PEZI|nr:hypothetical protein BDY21DRAFT_371173 [Lineolata rhizophorae]